MRAKLDVDRYRAFFFDFDGVVVDSVKIKGEAFGSLFAEYGSEVVEKVIDHHLKNGGLSRYDKFRYYYKEFLGKEITAEIMEELDRLYSERVVEKVIAAPAIGGVMDFITRLNSRDLPCYIVSATPEREVQMIARRRGIDYFFKEIVGSPRGKADNLAMLLNKYSILSEEAVFFGDAISDYRAAEHNHVGFVGVKFEELKIFPSVPIIQDFVSF